MKSATLLKYKRRKRRKNHVRSQLRKVSSLPRLSVHRSSKHIYAQVIDDEAGRTLVHAGSVTKALSSELAGKNKTQRAAVVGTEIAKKALEKGISQVAFDRGYSKYHGRVRALAEAAREAGLKF